ncbi:MAG: acyl-CoA reductase [Chitinophagaceae bacterium]|nr:acyl-CoA reductase [Chitinophagaceae bacterium]
MILEERISLLEKLGRYIQQNPPAWKQAKQKASEENPWFIPEFIDIAVHHLTTRFLQKEMLREWAGRYSIPDEAPRPYHIGIVMAGNVPLVGFHDWLCVFVSGHKAVIKTSSKDKILIRFLTDLLSEWSPQAGTLTTYAELLKGCDAYMATGSNNSSRYFEYYFGKYPHIIRKNKTSAAILTGKETAEELEKLADDVFLYFGLGCRNVTKIYVPQHYDFSSLFAAFQKYACLMEHQKYKNNYDYNLAIRMVNKQPFLTNGMVLLTENISDFSPVAQLNYEYYHNEQELTKRLELNENLQCVVGKNHLPFGTAQAPSLTDYPDGVDTMRFLLNLN